MTIHIDLAAQNHQLVNDILKGDRHKRFNVWASIEEGDDFLIPSHMVGPKWAARQSNIRLELSNLYGRKFRIDHDDRFPGFTAIHRFPDTNHGIF